jgi:hypothetical protein
MIAQFMVLRLEFGQAVLDGLKIDRRRRGVRMRMRVEDIGDSGADIAVQQGQKPLYKRQRQA